MNKRESKFKYFFQTSNIYVDGKLRDYESIKKYVYPEFILQESLKRKYNRIDLLEVLESVLKFRKRKRYRTTDWCSVCRDRSVSRSVQHINVGLEIILNSALDL